MHVEIDFEVDFIVSHAKAKYSFYFERKHGDYVLLYDIFVHCNWVATQWQ
jgi:hypothetical protein